MILSIDNARMFCDGLDHPEGIAAHPSDGTLWAGGEAGQIYRVSADGHGRVEQVAGIAGGFCLGLAFAPGGQWLAVCDLKNQCLWRLDVASGRLEKLANAAGPQHRISIPNSPAFDRAGNLYVSDSGGFRQITGKILRFDADDPTRGQVWHAGPLNFANGIALSPSQDALYVVCSWLPGIERIEIRPDGSAGQRDVVVTLPQTVPDGVAFGPDDGMLYVSCYAPSRIYRVGRNGNAEVLIEDWEAHTLCNPTNMAFSQRAPGKLYTTNLGRWHLTEITLSEEK